MYWIQSAVPHLRDATKAALETTPASAGSGAVEARNAHASSADRPLQEVFMVFLEGEPGGLKGAGDDRGLLQGG